jgi:hypothetical protein
MKKVLIGMLALVMCLGMVSCKKESAPNMADIVAKAKTEGANWSVDEWKDAYKQMMEAAKPMMLELHEVMTSMDTNDNASDAENAAKFAEAMAKIQEVQTKYGGLEKLMDEFESLAKGTENGKKVSQDEEWLKSLAKEIGLPEEL